MSVGLNCPMCSYRAAYLCDNGLDYLFVPSVKAKYEKHLEDHVEDFRIELELMNI